MVTMGEGAIEAEPVGFIILVVRGSMESRLTYYVG